MATVTAKKLEKAKDPTNGDIVVPVQFFYDGVAGDKILINGNDLTEDQISEKCFFAVKARQAREEAILLLTPGDVELKEPVATEQQTFFLALQDLMRLDARVKLGIIKVDDKEYTEALSLAQSLYKPGF